MTSTKALLLQDYLCSKKKNLGEFAIELMDIYDEISYELVLEDAHSKFGKVQGTAVMNDLDKMYKLIDEYKITGKYFIRVVDCQKEFFLILAEVRDYLKKK